MTLDQMRTLLTRAHALPHATAADVFMTAAIMAETIEGATQAESTKTKKRVKDGDTVITAAKLRARGLVYPMVRDCAHDLVDKKGLTIDAAAKQMGVSTVQVKAALRNWQMHHEPTVTNGARV